MCYQKQEKKLFIAVKNFSEIHVKFNQCLRYNFFIAAYDSVIRADCDRQILNTLVLKNLIIWIVFLKQISDGVLNVIMPLFFSCFLNMCKNLGVEVYYFFVKFSEISKCFHLCCKKGKLLLNFNCKWHNAVNKF